LQTGADPHLPKSLGEERQAMAFHLVNIAQRAVRHDALGS
jgi:hypothetical protein